MEKLLLVDKKDKVIGVETKENCHKGKGTLHRAFSVYVFNNKGQLLIQQRSKFKPLWPLRWWAPTCCSHPRKGEEYIDAGERRLKEEFGFTCSLKMIDKFQYHAKYKDVGSENEMCAILIGKYNGKIKADSKEIADWKWISVNKLQHDFKKNPNKYVPWLKTGFKRYFKIKEEEEKNKKELDLFLRETAVMVNPVIQELLESYIDKKFYKLINYQISTGGKRFRPGLTIISCKLLGGRIKDVLYPASGLEILHNCTLIVDDIIDHSQLRRNKPTVWFKFGQSVAECMGVDYLAAAFEGANHSKKPAKISEIFAKTLKTIINGEILDILFEQQGRQEEPYIVKNRYHKITKQKYYEMIGKKTASLAQSCCEVGGICAKASKKELKTLKDYGFNLGMAFQIRDDILDIFGNEKKFGKKIGKDIEERKLGNIVILSALTELSKSGKEKILKIIRKKEIKNKDIKEAIKLIKKTRACEKACSLAEEFSAKAKEQLKLLPKNKWNKALESLADFVVQREK
jgi:geranylgeranyl diphosphate synthase type I